MPRPDRLRRSELSTPATSQKMIEKAAASAADLVFLDLEDAVAPNEREGARPNIVAALNQLDWGQSVRAYRINGVHTHWCHGDIIEVVSGAGANLDVIIIPKVKRPRDVWFVDDMLTQLETKLGLEVGRIGLEVLIEETEALACVEDIAACSPAARSADPRRRRPVRQPGHAGRPHRGQGRRRRHRHVPGRHLALRQEPHDRGRPRQRHRRHRRAVRQLPQPGRLPP